MEYNTLVLYPSVDTALSAVVFTELLEPGLIGMPLRPHGGRSRAAIGAEIDPEGVRSGQAEYIVLKNPVPRRNSMRRRCKRSTASAAASSLSESIGLLCPGRISSPQIASETLRLVFSVPRERHLQCGWRFPKNCRKSPSHWRCGRHRTYLAVRAPR